MPHCDTPERGHEVQGLEAGEQMVMKVVVVVVAAVVVAAIVVVVVVVLIRRSSSRVDRMARALPRVRCSNGDGVAAVRGDVHIVRYGAESQHRCFVWSTTNHFTSLNIPLYIYIYHIEQYIIYIYKR